MGLTAVPLTTAVGGSTTACLLEQLCRLDAAASPDGEVLATATAEAAIERPGHGGQDPVDRAGSAAQSPAARPCRQRHQHFWRDRRAPVSSLLPPAVGFVLSSRAVDARNILGT